MSRPADRTTGSRHPGAPSSRVSSRWSPRPRSATNGSPPAASSCSRRTRSRPRRSCRPSRRGGSPPVRSGPRPGRCRSFLMTRVRMGERSGYTAGLVRRAALGARHRTARWRSNGRTTSRSCRAAISSIALRDRRVTGSRRPIRRRSSTSRRSPRSAGGADRRLAPGLDVDDGPPSRGIAVAALG